MEINKNSFLFLVLLIYFFLSVFSINVFAVECNVCADVITTFTPETVEFLGNVELKPTDNVITLKGHDSHGLKSVSIKCELACGKINQPCCYNETIGRYYCKANILYCSEQSINGKCLLDTTPPIIDIISQPDNGISSQCQNYLTQPVDIFLNCYDEQTGCPNFNTPPTDSQQYFGIKYYYHSPPSNNQCPDPTNNPAAYYYSSSLRIGSHGYVCGFVKDIAGNLNFTSTPKEVCVYADSPSILLWTLPSDIWGSYIKLRWQTHNVGSNVFNRYEIHYSTTPNFNITPETLYTKITDISTTTFIVSDLKPQTQYYFRVVVFLNTQPPQNATSNQLTVVTKMCDPDQKTVCFKDQYGKIWYGNDVYSHMKGNYCKAGNATCTGDGRWSTYCENQTGPNIEQCNGLDEDCDGYNDNMWTNNDIPLYKSCYLPGKCGWGVIKCINGEWQDPKTNCSSIIFASQEVCNGIDDDCNGLVDDGIENCGCSDGGVRRYEICNGIDDDCNGVIDDVYLPSTCACYKGAHKPGELQEICNGVDDDCNGTVDDFWIDILGYNWPWSFSACGQGTPCYGGHWECNKTGDGVVCSTIWGSENQAESEVCDGYDNDCDGSIDNDCDCSPPGSWRECGTNVGECRKGIQRCDAGKWSKCINSVEPKPEICDGKDNDCDGIIDNVNQGTSIEETKCKCFNGSSPGKEICNGIDDDCNGVIDDVYLPSTCACYKGAHKPGELQEICNGVDDDCNGTVDEYWSGLGRSCGVGGCSGGKIICNATGDGVTCSTNNKIQVEVCNGIDDDCNGVIDDILGKQSINETHCGCFNGAQKGDEKCNHIDDDCDGEIDEDLFCVCYEGETKPCGSAIGECKVGTAKCIDGVWSICEGGTGPVPEKCNMKDDDCDGKIDNVKGGYSVEETQCECFDGRPPQIEVCDGIDNDCNGLIDDIDCKCEEGQEMPCGSNVGECLPGIKRCINGRWSVCEGGTLPIPEVCNGKDDDCNGIVDDVGGGTSISSTKCACYNNYAKPGVNLEILNGIDDDCDGMIDEGFIGEEEPTHCFNDKKDGDEQGVDCGGSCKKRCPPPPINTWAIMFAIITAIITIFGIFFSYFWRSEKKSLFDRTRIMKIYFFCIFFVLGVVFILSFTSVMGQSYSQQPTPSSIKYVYSKTWTCTNGFPSNKCFTPPNCSTQLKVDGTNENFKEYNLTFNLPGNPFPLNYTCNITLISGFFDYDNSLPPENNENIDVYLNNEYLGTTVDTKCPSTDCKCKTPPKGTTYLYLCKSNNDIYYGRGRYGCGIDFKPPDPNYGDFISWCKSPATGCDNQCNDNCVCDLSTPVTYTRAEAKNNGVLCIAIFCSHFKDCFFMHGDDAVFNINDPILQGVCQFFGISPPTKSTTPGVNQQDGSFTCWDYVEKGWVKNEYIMDVEEVGAAECKLSWYRPPDKGCIVEFPRGGSPPPSCKTYGEDCTKNADCCPTLNCTNNKCGCFLLVWNGTQCTTCDNVPNKELCKSGGNAFYGCGWDTTSGTCKSCGNVNNPDSCDTLCGCYWEYSLFSGCRHVDENC